MFSLFGIGFVTPWILAGLLALPILWVLLRAVPPAPVRRLFPGVVLLLGLRDDDAQSDKTPWWLLLIRTLAIAAVIIGFAGPVLNPRDVTPGTGPLLILVDGTWADAADWPVRLARIETALQEASRDARPVAVVTLSSPDPGPPVFQSADSWRSRLPGLQPMAWEPNKDDLVEWSKGLSGSFETYWLSDGTERDSREEMLAALQMRGPVRVFEGTRPVYGLRPAVFEDDAVTIRALRSRVVTGAEIEVIGHGLDPSGVERVLTRVPLAFAPGENTGEVSLSIPAEIRNRITRFSIDGVRSAAAVSLTDDALKRREVALVSGQKNREGLQLLSQTHYLEQALEPTADLIDGTLGDIMLAKPDVIILADIATLAPSESDAIAAWLDAGGLLVRFAGPKLAASDISRAVEDPLMPVRLRAGGRTVGGAMSWGEPKKLAPFAQGSPFYGLEIPADVTVSSQVMAEPDPSLSGRVIAALADGTPLVTRKKSGQGQIVLFHVTANAQWSTLPLSGLFVQMLERLAVSTAPARPDRADLVGSTWVPVKVLDGFGTIQSAENMAGIAGEDLARGIPGPQTPPGLYVDQDRQIAMNVIGADTIIAPAVWPADVPVEGFAIIAQTAFKATLLSLALFLLALDLMASLMVTGRLRMARSVATTALVVMMLGVPPEARAQSDSFALDATSQMVLAYVITGNTRLDQVSEAGLRGLSDVLFARTSVEPADPIAVDLERDELAFFPLLYWPVTPDQPLPSGEAYARLNRYIRSGGMILFDTRDANTARFGTSSVNGRKLQQLARPLDIPPLEPIPADHVLTRTFYLLQDFAGRYLSRDVWVEASYGSAQQVEGMPFRNLNDNVTPVVIGGNDWAAAWAVDTAGNLMFPVGRGSAGERQRELAYRFGVNLVMYVLTGNYKSDQVHVPALLDRLGQ